MGGRTKNVTKTNVIFLSCPNIIIGDIMHNLISYNQLAGWRQSVTRLKNTLDQSIEESDTLNDYYNCLINCDDNQNTCKRICRSVLE